MLRSSETANETHTDANNAEQTEQSQNNQDHKDNGNIKESNVLQENEEHSDVEQDNQKLV